MQTNHPQTADHVFMVRPAAFGANAETAASNAFQSASGLSAGEVARSACDEFDAFVRQLRAEGVRVTVGADRPDPPRPDALFPNNWISFHADGTLVLYPMLAPNRRLERRAELIEQVLRETGFRVARTVDLSACENDGWYLEGTGSLVLDHLARVAYAVPSPRTDASLARRWCEQLGYELELFAALDAHGRPYYHTNVVLSIGARFAVLLEEGLVPGERERVIERLRSSGREVIGIDRAQAGEFCANVLELATWDEALGDSSVLALSRRARAAFRPEQWQRLRACVDAVVAAPLPVIERIGGGGARCMLAEVFLPR